MRPVRTMEDCVQRQTASTNTKCPNNKQSKIKKEEHVILIPCLQMWKIPTHHLLCRLTDSKVEIRWFDQLWLSNFEKMRQSMWGRVTIIFVFSIYSTQITVLWDRLMWKKSTRHWIIQDNFTELENLSEFQFWRNAWKFCAHSSY